MAEQNRYVRAYLVRFHILDFCLPNLNNQSAESDPSVVDILRDKTVNGKYHHLHKGLEVLADEATLVFDHVVGIDFGNFKTKFADAIEPCLELLYSFLLFTMDHSVHPKILDDAEENGV